MMVLEDEKLEDHQVLSYLNVMKICLADFLTNSYDSKPQMWTSTFGGNVLKKNYVIYPLWTIDVWSKQRFFNVDQSDRPLLSIKKVDRAHESIH